MGLAIFLNIFEFRLRGQHIGDPIGCGAGTAESDNQLFGSFQDESEGLPLMGERLGFDDVADSVRGRKDNQTVWIGKLGVGLRTDGCQKYGPLMMNAAVHMPPPFYSFMYDGGEE